MLRFLAPLLILGLALPAPGIVRRHDVPDERYRELFAEHAELGRSVARIGLAHGTLIAPRWILSAAHVVDGVSPFSGTVEIDGRTVAVRRVILHPSWVGDLGPGLAEPEWIDIALLELAEPLMDTPTIPLWETLREPKRVLFLGSGRSGDGEQGPVEEFGIWRAATNVLADRTSKWLCFRFDRDGLELEGISGPGDSGGPGLMQDRDGVWRLAGISSRNDGEPECRYDSLEYYTRVSRYLPWIREQMKAAPGAEPGGPCMDVVDAFFAAYNAGDLAPFAREQVVDSELRSQDEFAELWSRQRERQGTVTPVHRTQVLPHKIFVLAAGENHWREYHFELESQAPYRVRSLKVQRVQKKFGAPLPAAADHHQP